MVAIFQHLNRALSFLAFDCVSKPPFPSPEMSLAVYKSEHTLQQRHTLLRGAREKAKRNVIFLFPVGNVLIYPKDSNYQIVAHPLLCLYLILDPRPLPRRTPSGFP